MLPKRNTLRIGAGIGLITLSASLVSGCFNFSLPRNFDKKHTPNYAEEAKGMAPGAIAGGGYRMLSGSTYNPANTGWATLLGGYIGGEIRAHPEMLVTELQNKGVNAFFMGETLVIGIHTDDIFYPGSTEVRPDAEANLNTIANLLARYSDQDIFVEGFGDDPGDIFDNIDRAEARASSVAAYMWANGVKADRFRIINHGDPDTTVADLATASGLADNRHVVLCTKADPTTFGLDWPLQM